MAIRALNPDSVATGLHVNGIDPDSIRIHVSMWTRLVCVCVCELCICVCVCVCVCSLMAEWYSL